MIIILMYLALFSGSRQDFAFTVNGISEFQPALFEKYNRDHIFSSVLRLTCTIFEV